MMTALSAVFTGLVGPLFRWVTLPLLILSAFTFGKIAWEKRDARILAQGEMICDARWRDAVRAEEQRQADARVNQTRRLLEAERQNNEGLKDEIGTIRVEMAKIRAAADFSADSKCLSDGVLEELNRGESPSTKHRGS